MSENVKPDLKKFQEKFGETKPDIRVPVVAAILMAGEVFRKGLKENEAEAVAKRLVKVAKTIVNEC